MSDYDVDLFVIGAGSGGVRTARMSAQYGARVIVAEEQYLGGTCVNVGCVPKKLFVYASAFAEEFTTAAGFGWTVPPQSFDWPTLRDNKNREIERLNGIYRNLLKQSGVELIEGRAQVTGPHSVVVNGREYTARNILLCTGGRPHVPDFPGNEHAITSEDAFYLDTLPKRIVIVGGGYIAVEFAGIFHGLGVETHLLYRGPLFLRGFDEDVRKHLAEEMLKKGVHLHFETTIQEISKDPSKPQVQLSLSLSDGSTMAVDSVMYATGRKANIQNLGLETTAVSCDSRGAIEVDDFFQTREPSIYALGDVIGRVELTPVAIREGMALSENLFKGGTTTVDYDFIPTAVFSQPNIGTVGFSEAEAQEKYGDIQVFESRFKPMKQTLGGIDEKVYMKLIVDSATDRVVGCHMVGESAGEIMQGLGVAVKAGATKADFDATVGIHPTAAEEFVTMRAARSD
ncbi:MAG: glutathione-disulfide reductase [Porticoccaceae bacterium]|nr:glutathione-disulfide reductase [Porticoccaceae bacterium]